MTTIHTRNGALYLGTGTAVPIAETVEFSIDVDFDTSVDAAMGDTWESRLKHQLRWVAAAAGSYDTAQTTLFDAATSLNGCRAYLYWDRSVANCYFGMCYPNVRLDAKRTDAGRVAVALTGSGAIATAVARGAASGYWKFDDAIGAATALDSSGNGHNLGYLLGTPTYQVAGLITPGTAMTMDDTHGDYLFATTDGVLILGAAQSFAWEGWFSTTRTQLQMLVTQISLTAGKNANLVMLTPSGCLWFLLMDGSGAPGAYTSALVYGIFNDGGAHYFSCVRDRTAGTVALYVDGVLKRTVTDITTGGVTPGGGGNNTTVVGAWVPNSPDNGFFGTLDDFALYLAAPTALQVSTTHAAKVKTAATSYSDGYGDAVLADSPAAWYRLQDAIATGASFGWTVITGTVVHDWSGAGWDAECVGAVPTLNRPALAGNGYGMGFTVLLGAMIGASAVSTGPLYFAAGTSFTLEAWFKTSSATEQTILAERLDGTTGSWILSIGATGTLTWSIKDTGGATSSVSAAGAYANGATHHVVAVRNAHTTLTLYVDGVQVAQASDTTTAAWTETAGSVEKFTIGGRNGVTPDLGNYFFVGDLDEIAVYRKALSGTQIAAHYAAR